MRTRTLLISAVIAGAASLAIAQDKTTTTETKQTTVQNPDGSTSTSSTTVTGEIVRYEPGKTIVIRRSNNTEATYTLDAGVQVPGDVAVGRQVTLVTQTQDGTVHIRKITTTMAPGSMGTTKTESESMSTPPGQPASSETTQSSQQTTETRSTASIAPAQEPPPSGTQDQTTQQTTTTHMTTVTGTVQAYEPGQSITIVGPNHKVTTYTISGDVQAPQTVAVGKKVTVQTTTVDGKPVIKSFTSKTTTKTTKTKTVSPQ